MDQKSVSGMDPKKSAPVICNEETRKKMSTILLVLTETKSICMASINKYENKL